MTQAFGVERTEGQVLPLVRVEKAYSFEGTDGQVSLLELFGEQRQLTIQHFVFDL